VYKTLHCERVPNGTTVTNVPKVTKNYPSVPVFGSVHCFLHGLLKEPIISALKLKMANARHIVLAVFFVFLLRLGLQQAAAFVSSPIHLFRNSEALCVKL